MEGWHLRIATVHGVGKPLGTGGDMGVIVEFGCHSSQCGEALPVRYAGSIVFKIEYLSVLVQYCLHPSSYQIFVVFVALAGVRVHCSRRLCRRGRR